MIFARALTHKVLLGSSPNVARTLHVSAVRKYYIEGSHEPFAPIPGRFPQWATTGEQAFSHLTDGAKVFVHGDTPRSNRPERRTTLVAREMACYKVDIAALNETRFSEQGQLEELGAGYTFFWSGRPRPER
nr:unnamed protein product [Spirometra erinaceieuropaei]